MPPLGPYRALVVDDNLLVRVLMADVLRFAGLVIIEADGPAGALAALEQDQNIRLLLIDAELDARGDGVLVAREAQSKWPNLAVIVTSGHDAHELALGDDVYFLPKPWMPGQLLSAANRVLRTKEP